MRDALERLRARRAADSRFGVPFQTSCKMQQISATQHRKLEGRGELVVLYDGKKKIVTLDSIYERQARLLIASNPADGSAPKPRATPAAFRDGPYASALARSKKPAAREAEPA